MTRKEAIKHFESQPCNVHVELNQRAMDLVRAEKLLSGKDYKSIILHALETCLSEEVE